MKYTLLLLALPCFGCGAIILDRMIDKAAEMQEKAMKQQIELEKVKRKELHVVEGEVASATTVERQVEKVDSTSNFSVQVGKPKASGTADEKPEPPKEKEYVTKKIYVVKFVDGRELEFSKAGTKPLTAGKYYLIQYNGMDEIIDIKEVKPDTTTENTP